MSNFRPTDRRTGFLMPPSVEEWLPQRHLARFVVEVVDGLDLRTLSGAYRGSGSASYHPAVLLSLLVYGYAVMLPLIRVCFNLGATAPDLIPNELEVTIEGVWTQLSCSGRTRVALLLSLPGPCTEIEAEPRTTRLSNQGKQWSGIAMKCAKMLLN